MIFVETPELYKKITSKYILSLDPNNVTWLENIVAGSAEVQHVIGRDEDLEQGFVLCKDWKWAGDLIDDLYLLAICNRKDIKSIRDLNSTHLPLLRNMKKKILLWITEKYKVPESKLLLYVHYPPSHYHFHVHVSHLENSRGKLLGKSILFHELVENLELFDNYYLVRSLQFSLSSSHPLAVDLLEGGSYVPDR
eukprot:TRINITY_DN1070_c0_g1_i6.p1 TRINITY_DN1070_c0_g1~~TRINITY_DN1070_c0_g1_i6.p1  ORF type:complete len:194 (+),score=37.68 TRINITY_DN1070_c0_g1_i6:426-1007(+)